MSLENSVESLEESPGDWIRQSDAARLVGVTSVSLIHARRKLETEKINGQVFISRRSLLEYISNSYRLQDRKKICRRVEAYSGGRVKNNFKSPNSFLKGDFWITISDASILIGIHRRTVDAAIQREDWGVRRVGRNSFVRLSDLLSYADRTYNSDRKLEILERLLEHLIYSRKKRNPPSETGVTPSAEPPQEEVTRTGTAYAEKDLASFEVSRSLKDGLSYAEAVEFVIKTYHITPRIDADQIVRLSPRRSEIVHSRKVYSYTVEDLSRGYQKWKESNT